MKVEILTDHYPHVDKGLVSSGMLLAIYKWSVRILIFKASILKRDYYLKKRGTCNKSNASPKCTFVKI